MTDQLTDLAIDNVKCDYCGAEPGERCVARPSGRPAVYPHVARMDLIWTAYQIGREAGYTHGMTAGKRILRRAQLAAEGLDERAIWHRLNAEGL